MQSTQSPASPKQINFLNRLRTERGLARLSDAEAAELTGGRDGTASAAIDALLDSPSRPAERTVEISEIGVYEADGVVFVVKRARESGNLYAKRIREIGGSRITEAGTFVAVEFDYDPGAIFGLRPEHKIDGERAKALTIRYGFCIVCQRDLKAGESVLQGIGPKCVESFPELVEERKAIKAAIRAEAKAAKQAGEPAGPVDLVALARKIEGSPEPTPEPAPEPKPVYEHPIDARARRARLLIVQGLSALRAETDVSADEVADALATFDALVSGFER